MKAVLTVASKVVKRVKKTAAWRAAMRAQSSEWSKAVSWEEYSDERRVE